MRKIIYVLVIILAATNILLAKELKIVTSYPYIADIAKKIVQNRAEVDYLARGDFDPHTIIPKPSYIAKLRRADLLIINGAQLEIGWMPPLLNRANNANVQPGNPGFLSLANYMKLIDVHKSVSRAQGDVHPDGNPHFYLDPYNIPVVIKVITKKLCAIDPVNEQFYKKNGIVFLQQWAAKLKIWQAKMNKLHGMEVVEYHKNYDYLLHRFKLSLAGTVEPLPGIPPTSRHIQETKLLIKKRSIRFILQDVYNSNRASNYLARETGARVIVLPHDVYAVEQAKDIFSLFDEIVKRLTNE